MSCCESVWLDHGKCSVAHGLSFMERKGKAWQADTKKKDLHLPSVMKDISSAFEEMNSPSRVVVTMHQKPDPDAMGSSLALWHFLKGLGHDVTVISPTNWADFLDWMPGVDSVVDYESQGEKARSILSETQWLFCLEFNHFSRTRHTQVWTRYLILTPHTRTWPTCYGKLNCFSALISIISAERDICSRFWNL